MVTVASVGRYHVELSDGFYNRDPWWKIIPSTIFAIIGMFIFIYTGATNGSFVLLLPILGCFASALILPDIIKKQDYYKILLVQRTATYGSGVEIWEKYIPYKKNGKDIKAIQSAILYFEKLATDMDAADKENKRLEEEKDKRIKEVINTMMSPPITKVE
jgi:hypothetical protein